MENREWEQRLRDAASHAAPDDLAGLLSACEKKKGAHIIMNENKNASKKRWTAIIAAAAALAILVTGGVLGFVLGSRNHTDKTPDEPNVPDTPGVHDNPNVPDNPDVPNTPDVVRKTMASVIFDVNPSVEIQVGEDGTVLGVTALNAEGEEVLGDMTLTGVNLETVVNALIGAFLQKGYLTDLQNAILVSVEGTDGGDTGELEEKVRSTVSAALEGSGLTGAVFSQNITPDDELTKLAEQYGISVGKAALITEFAARDGSFSLETLSKLTITELALLAESRELSVPAASNNNASSSAEAPSNPGQYFPLYDNAYPGKTMALEAACGALNLPTDGLLGVEVGLDYEDGRTVYEAEFCYDGTEYDVEVDSRTWEVIRYKTEPCTHKSHKPVNAEDIGEAKAFEVAAADVGVQMSELQNCSISWDDDCYKVKFCHGGKEHEYEIDCWNGTVLEHETEVCHHQAHTPIGTADIGKAAAFEAACAHAGVPSGDALDWFASREDGCYDVTFCHSGVEYEYEIDRWSGEVLEHETDECDHPHHPGHHVDNEHHDDDHHYIPDAQLIGKEAALHAALIYLNLEYTELPYHTEQYDADDGVYDVEICSGGTEYDLEVDAVTGAVLKCETDACDHPEHQGQQDAQDIGRTKAIEAACAHANVPVGEALDCTASRDDDCYDVTFCHNGVEYDYEIDCWTGAVLEHDTDECDHPRHPGHKVDDGHHADDDHHDDDHHDDDDDFDDDDDDDD